MSMRFHRREEEFNNRYTCVHLVDVLNMKDAAIAELTHRLTALPGYYIGGSHVKRTEILTPAIKANPGIE